LSDPAGHRRAASVRLRSACSVRRLDCRGSCLSLSVCPAPALAVRTGPGLGVHYRGERGPVVRVLSGAGARLVQLSSPASPVHSHVHRTSPAGNPCSHLLAPGTSLTCCAKGGRPVKSPRNSATTARISSEQPWRRWHAPPCPGRSEA